MARKKIRKQEIPIKEQEGPDWRAFGRMLAIGRLRHLGLAPMQPEIRERMEKEGSLNEQLTTQRVADQEPSQKAPSIDNTILEHVKEPKRDRSLETTIKMLQSRIETHERRPEIVKVLQAALDELSKL